MRWSRGLLHVITRDPSALKYKLVLGDAAPPPTATAARRVRPGENIRVSLPRGCSLKDACVWEVGDEHRGAEVRPQEQGFSVSVPSDVENGDHVWLRMPAEPSGDLYLDFVVVR